MKDVTRIASSDAFVELRFEISLDVPHWIEAKRKDGVVKRRWLFICAIRWPTRSKWVYHMVRGDPGLITVVASESMRRNRGWSVMTQLDRGVSDALSADCSEEDCGLLRRGAGTRLDERSQKWGSYINFLVSDISAISGRFRLEQGTFF